MANTQWVSFPVSSPGPLLVFHMCKYEPRFDFVRRLGMAMHQNVTIPNAPNPPTPTHPPENGSDDLTACQPKYWIIQTRNMLLLSEDHGTT